MCKLSWYALLAAALAVVSMGNRMLAADDPPKPGGTDAVQATGGAIQTTSTFRSSKLVGMGVQNPAGEDLGEIEDLVIDLDTGTVRYAALSFGGFLGLGDKLFAVPMGALKFDPSKDNPHFVLDVDKQRLEKAPGFNKDAWPDFADPNWGAEVDAFYTPAAATTGEATPGRRRHVGRLVAAAIDRLTMADASGGNRRVMVFGPDVKVTLDGQSADMKDLKKGCEITVTTGEREGQPVVVSIDARSKKAE